MDDTKSPENSTFSDSHEPADAAHHSEGSNPSWVQSKTFGVFGLGKAGKAAVAMLEAQGATVYADDDAQDTDTPFDSWPWESLDGLVLSPGVPLTHPQPHPVVQLAKQHEVEILGDVELLYRTHPDATYIGITGTNGKSTTTALIGHLCDKLGVNVAVGGNLGIPAAELAMGDAHDVYVLEMSSFQLDLLSTVTFHIAVFLNLTPDHLDRHGSLEGYAIAKMHIFERQTEDDFAVLSVDDDYCRLFAANIGGRHTIRISAQTKADLWINDDGVIFDGAVEYTPELPAGLRGAHNRQNVIAAYGAVRALGHDGEATLEHFTSFESLPHRMQPVGTRGSVEFINDSKATNADAASKSLGTFENIYWIVGGVPKAGGIEPLEPYFKRIKHAYLIGEAAEQFATTLGDKVAHSRYDSLEDATRAASAQASTDGGGVVLLAPACASFDQFANFEARGDAFVACAKSLLN